MTEADEIAANLPAPIFVIDDFDAAASFLRENGVSEDELGHQQFDNVVEAWMRRFRPRANDNAPTESLPIVRAMAKTILTALRRGLLYVREGFDLELLAAGFTSAEINRYRNAALRLARKESTDA